MQLYSSRRFALTGIGRQGKKQVAGILDFKGLPSACGSDTEVLAIDEGIVIDAGPDFRYQMLRTGVRHLDAKAQKARNLRDADRARRSHRDLFKAGVALCLEG